MYEVWWCERYDVEQEAADCERVRCLARVEEEGDAQETALLWRRLLEVSRGDGQVVVMDEAGQRIFGPYCVVSEAALA